MKKLILFLLIFYSAYVSAQVIPIPQVTGLPAALNSKVDKVTGKSLVADTSIVKLTGIQAGAQVNKLEGIQKNGVDLTITGKKVNITVPTTAAEIGAQPAGTYSTDIHGNISALNAVSNINTGDETTATIKTKLGIATLSGANTGDQTSVSGNAGTATKLQTSRTINGVAFDGTQNITVNAVDATSRVASSLLGAANGVATLDANGIILTTQLPSYIDDVLEYTNLAAFPASGETGKIYVAKDTNKTYRWSGSVYVYITSGAVDSVNGLTGVVSLSKSDLGLGNLDNTSDANKPISTATQSALNGKQASGTYSTDIHGNITALNAVSGINGGDETLTSIKTKLGAASSSNSGYLTNTDFSNFSGKQPAGTYATGTGTATGTNTGDNAVNSLYSGLVSNATHTGDVTGSSVLTLATVNSNVGTYNNVTINAKGQATGGSNVGYLTSISSGQVTTALGYTPYNSTNPNSYIPLTSLSSTATGLTYTNTTGAFSLTSGYSIPTTANQTNWATAYGWGNHAGLYRPISYVPSWSEITSKPTTLSGYGITDAAIDTHTHSSLFNVVNNVTIDLNTLDVTGKVSYNKFGSSSTNAFPAINNANAVLTINTYDALPQWSHQLGFSANGNMYQRMGTGVWNKVWTSGNFDPANYSLNTHSHGNITNSGYIGSTASLPIITGTGGIIQVGAFGTTAGTFCQGNDSRLSDSRSASDVYSWAKSSTKPAYSFAEITSKPTTLSGYGITDTPWTNYLPLSGGTLTGVLTLPINNQIQWGGNSSMIYGSSGVLNLIGAAFFSSTVTATQFNGSAAGLTSFPTLNQNTTGSAATLTTSRTIWGQNFNGSGNITGAISGATTGTFSGKVTVTDVTDATIDPSLNGSIITSGGIAAAKKIQAGGEIFTKGNFVADGDLYTGGEVSAGTTITATGNIYSNGGELVSPVYQTQSTVNGSTSGNMVCSMPFRTGTYKKVTIYPSSLNGNAVYTFPTAFSGRYKLNTTVMTYTTYTTVIASATSLTITGGSNIDGQITIEGY